MTSMVGGGPRLAKPGAISVVHPERVFMLLDGAPTNGGSPTIRDPPRLGTLTFCSAASVRISAAQRPRANPAAVTMHAARRRRLASADCRSGRTAVATHRLTCTLRGI
ncbi:MAG TPA: hypothetical protein VNT27_03790 [Propionibacteriaceae bacterium]|nr:hypothetical protein [Propionibacteriaceae bacterium]